MSAACLKFQTPVTGGNVSFYNQSSFEGPVFPTPTIGMLGILKNKSSQMTLDFKQEGDLIYLIGASQNDISSSEYLYSYHKIKNSPAPHFNLDEEYKVQQAIKAMINAGLIQSAHDVSDGGLFITLMESAMPRGLGFDVSSDDEFRKDAFLFGEAQSRVVVSVKKENEDSFINLMMNEDVEFNFIGEVYDTEMLIDDESYGNIKDAKDWYDNALGDLLK